MAFKARVYLRRPGEFEPTYIGAVDVDPRPVREGRTTFTHGGKTVRGRVETVEPIDWDASGAIPTIHVVQR